MFEVRIPLQGFFWNLVQGYVKVILSVCFVVQLSDYVLHLLKLVENFILTVLG